MLPADILGPEEPSQEDHYAVLDEVRAGPWAWNSGPADCNVSFRLWSNLRERRTRYRFVDERTQTPEDPNHHQEVYAGRFPRRLVHRRTHCCRFEYFIQLFTIKRPDVPTTEQNLMLDPNVIGLKSKGKQIKIVQDRHPHGYVPFTILDIISSTLSTLGSVRLNILVDQNAEVNCQNIYKVPTKKFSKHAQLPIIFP